MTETQKRIKAYQEALPGLRERVVAVALLLAMSMAMMTSASFAWLTISRRPEVSGVNTTIASNGNLEIALATGDGKTPPGESKVGDSSAAEGQNIFAANQTWGNLINLSDPSYGLENLSLRPAQLNTSALLVSPLYGAQYGIDGRITQLDSSFRYTIWTPADGDKPAHFAVSEQTGVRAISSTKIEAVGAVANYTKMLEAAKNTNLAAANMYVNLGNNDKYMPSLATMMGLYMTARMNPDDASLSNPDCAIEDIQNLRDMYAAFEACFDKEAEAIANLLNLQLFLKHGEGQYEPYTGEMVYTATEAGLKEKGLQISNLNQFIKDHNTIVSDLEKLRTIASSGTSLKWKDSGLNGIVNNLVNVGACTIGADNTPISSIGASNATNYLSGTQEARITNGILYRFEERTGGYIQVKNLGISATVKRMGITIPATVKANIQTSAPRDYNLFSNDRQYTEGLNTGEFQGGVPVAKETFGLALDLWVRTNADKSYLTLEGNILTEVEEDVPVTGTDSNGNTVDIFTLTRTEEVENDNGATESVSYSVDVYKKETEESDGTVTTTYYNAETHSVVEKKEDDKILQKVTDIITVVGYEGENRIWNGTDYEGMLSTDATTQGSGSCYVYYADTPEDQARSLKLLEAYNVAFVDAKGKLLATAFMDTENFYAANGRVTVPLVLSPSSSINLGEDVNGVINYAITPLEKNVPTRVTAIVYLDGTKLTNQEVLAAAEIQGQLNIQFGNSLTLSPIDNEELANKERKVTASVDKTEFNYDEADGDMVTNVTVHVDGDAPNKVTAFFIRAISSTQGSRETVMEFTQNADGDWIAAYEFTSPGNYVLRTVQLDGVEYTLETPPAVEVKGFAVKSMSGDSGSHVKIMTAANTTSVKLNLQFATDDVSKMPKTVQGRYLRDEDGSAVNVDFTYNANTKTWYGTATFLTSGTYTMQYLVLDGQYRELDAAMWQTADITLGMRVAVYTTSPHSFQYVPSEMADNEKLLGMQVKIMDNTGEEMPGLTGVKLTYGMKGSGIKKMDTDLKWDGKYYSGELTTTGPGIWQFSNVTVLGNTLTSATTYPTFTVMSPEPPEYFSHSTAAAQTKMNPATDPAVMNAQITNSQAASVQAYIVKDGASEGTWVTGTIGGEFTTTDGTAVNNWSFTVPKDANGWQDGRWQLTALRLWDVFAEDGSPYTEESPLEINVTGYNIKTTVVNRVFVTFATDKSQNFGLDADGKASAQFMTSHTISGLNVDIKDFEGNPISGVSDVKLVFTYKPQSSNDYGSYVCSDFENSATAEGKKYTVALNVVSGANYAQGDTIDLFFAGEYYTGLLFKINGAWNAYGDVNGDGKVGEATLSEGATATTVREQTLPNKAPEFTVSSKAPTVTITSVSTNTVDARFFTTTTPSSYDHVITGLKNWKSDNGFTASVFMYADGPSGPADSELVKLQYPTVSLSLAGIPAEHEGVTFVVPNAANSSTSNTFTFASGKFTASSAIGSGQNGEISYGILGASIGSWPKLYPVGKQEIKTINVSYNDMEFVVKLSNTVKISQTTMPPYADLIVDEETYSGTTRIYSEDTENVVLSKISWTTSGIEIGDDATVGAWSQKTLHTDHGHKQWKWWYFTNDRYMPFYWTEFSRTITGTQTPYTTTYTINKWIVNGKEYDVSKNAVMFNATSGSIEATAVVTVTTVYGDTAKTTVTEVKYGYVAGSETSSNPGGSQIGGTVNSEDGAYENPSVGIANTSTGVNMYDDKDKYLECTNRG